MARLISPSRRGLALGALACVLLPRAVQATAEWYRARHQAGARDMVEFSARQLEEYVADARAMGASWAG